MGNYHNIEYDFIERTIRLISQYQAILDQYPFEEQYNYTLTINCLLGLIIMPKERVISFIPITRLTTEFKQTIGLEDSIIHSDIQTLRDLIQTLRHSIAHFDIHIKSDTDENHIDWINFKDTEDGNTIASFKANELVPFLEYYSTCLLENLKRHA